MCGIVGFSAHGPGLDIEAGIAAISHRGPDARGAFENAEQHVCLGQTRLAIIDLSPAGRQPMTTACGRYTIVFNGEIYNYLELREELLAAGIRFAGKSDTEVLLYAFQLQGEAVLPRLNGIFAFAIHDAETGELFLARDALGTKPLYYEESGLGFVFSSEIKSILAAAPQNRDLNAAAVAKYLSFLWCPGEETPLATVRKLEPGCALRVREGRVISRTRWYTLPEVRRTAYGTGSVDEVAQELRSHLRTAVRRQLVGDVPLGAFLSGGLDSSSIVAFAREEIEDLSCFTIKADFDREHSDKTDFDYAQDMARHLRVPLNVVEVRGEEFIDNLETMIWQLDEPLADPAALNVYFISQYARRNGIKVLLSGAGGDDIFTGYRRHLALAGDRILSAVPPFAKAGLLKLVRNFNGVHPAFRRLSKLLATDPTLSLVGYFLWSTPAQVRALLSEQARARIGTLAPAQGMLDFLNALPPDRDPVSRMLALEQRFFLGDHNLIYTDKMSMAAGVEVRVPFLDPDLMEFAASIPPRMKQHGAQGKWIFKKAMEGILPLDAIYRSKMGFGAPLRGWMKSELVPLRSELLSKASLDRRGLFDHGAVQALVRDTDENRTDGVYTLFSLMCIEIWCRKFLD